MKRKQRTHLLIDVAPELAARFAEEIKANYELEWIQEPEEALTMIKMRETGENSLFYIGEVLVTESKVRINNQVGLGLVKGDQPELSEALAIVDAAYEAELSEIKSWQAPLEEAAGRYEKEQEDKIKQLSQSKVSFETMEE